MFNYIKTIIEIILTNIKIKSWENKWIEENRIKVDLEKRK